MKGNGEPKLPALVFFTGVSPRSSNLNLATSTPYHLSLFSFTTATMFSTFDAMRRALLL